MGWVYISPKNCGRDFTVRKDFFHSRDSTSSYHSTPRPIHSSQATAKARYISCNIGKRRICTVLRIFKLIELMQNDSRNSIFH